MKKKVLALITALACVSVGAFGLTACGDDDDATKKHHTAEQWTAAFSDPSVTDCYSFSEMLFPANATTGGQIRSLAYDKNSEYYYYSHGSITVEDDTVSSDSTTSDVAYKKNRHYYTQSYDSDTGDSNIYEITADQFAAKINNNSFADVADRLLDGCKNRYDDFDAHGTTVWGSDISGRYYEAKNVRVDIDQSLSIVFEKVTVGVTDAGALYDIEATFDGEDITKEEPATAKHKYYYRNEDSDSYANVPRVAPSRLEGNTFRLVRIEDANAEGAPSEYDTWIASVIAANSNKTITAKADGTLEGDIEIDMGGGASLALNTMKYTENFFYDGEGEYGDITVSNAHIPGLTEAQKVTLTGNIAKDGSYSGAGYNNAFKLTLNQDGQVFAYYFAPVAN